MKPFPRALSTLALAGLALMLSGSSRHFGADLLGQAQAATALTFPDEGKKEADFIPAGWKIWKSASGDLNGDHRPDKALIIVAKDDNPERLPQKSKTPRVVLVLLANKDGSLKRDVLNFGAVLSGQAASDFGLNSVKLAIDHDNVVITNAGSGPKAQSIVAKFNKHVWQKMTLVDLTRQSSNLKECQESNWHHDLESGMVVSSSSTWQDDGQGRKKKGSEKTQRQKYKLLRSGSFGTAPEIDGSIQKREWPGLDLKLDSRDDVVAGKELGKGPEEFSVTLGSLHLADSLFIRGAITGNHLDPDDRFVLFDAHGNEITPMEMKSIFSKTITTFEAHYDLKELGARHEQKCWLLPVALEVQNIDPKTKKPRIILSTSPAGRKDPKGILVAKNPGQPLLAHWNLELPDD